jgi:hypothetical protein
LSFPSIQHKNGHSTDIARIVASDLAYIHDLLIRADELYRLYREALFNLERHRDQPRAKSDLL